MSWFGLGRPRSKFGVWLDRQEILQQELAKECKVSHATISRLCTDKNARPNYSTASKIIKTLRKYNYEVSAEDFWD